MRVFRIGICGLSLVCLAANPGCAPEAIPPEQAIAIPVHNPSPDNPLKDVTLENESEHLKKIGGISK